MNLERQILLHLFTYKFQLNSRRWRASDDAVLNQIHEWLTSSEKYDLDLDQVKQHVKELEERVKRHKEQTEEIMEDTAAMLEVFDYVMPEFVPETPETEIYPTSSIKRLKSTSYLGIPSHSNDSIGKQFSRLLDSRLSESPFSMACCTEKLQQLGFKEPEIFDAIEILKNDLEAREVFIKLDSPAKGYVVRLLNKS